MKILVQILGGALEIHKGLREHMIFPSGHYVWYNELDKMSKSLYHDNPFIVINFEISTLMWDDES